MSVTKEAVQAIVEARHGQPFSVLGSHVEDEGGAKYTVVRTFQPDAKKVWIVEPEGGQVLGEARKIHDSGLFELKLGTRDAKALYRVRFETQQGKTVELFDPYQFDSLLSDFDLHLLREGTHHRTWEKLGSHRVTLRGVAGVHFAVWAPNAERVSVIGDFNNWDGRRHAMRHHEGNGLWELFVPGMTLGENYKYEIRTPSNPVGLTKTDPYAFHVEMPPKTASRTWDLGNYTWKDGEWMEKRRKWNFLASPISIYEIHFGSWRHKNDGGDRSLSYREMAQELAEYCKEMGYTHVELMPITEHPYYASWGYQTVNFFAPTSRFGNPDDLRYFMDVMHQNGIGVILDWVPAHFPTDAYGLAEFDGTHLYEHADPRKGKHPDWNTLVFNYGRTEVWNFLLANALFWLDQYHFDGLRVDAVASMLYLDYSRKQGEWIPNKYGGKENIESIEFLKSLNVLVHQKFPGVLTIAEESTAWGGVSRPTYVGGLGFSMKWNMGWMHDILDFFSKDSIYRKWHANRLTFSMLYQYTENFCLSLSHDEVTHGKGSLIGKMPGDEWQKRANLRALFGYMYGHPGKKLHFMGSEFGQYSEWNHDHSLDWHLLQYPGHQGLKQWMKDLNRVYKTEKSLFEKDFEPGGFRWIDCNDADSSVYTFLRFANDPTDFTVFACNLTPVPRHGYRVGVPEAGLYLELLNSDAGCYGGSNVGNNGQVWAEPWAWQGFNHSLQLTLPPLSVTVFKKKSGT